MYLKKLSLKGFKSFPIKTEILFEKGITAIVGPNGSGKSNISDAIRWVLGEQSVKSLRGEKMEDVIFSGTDNKKQHNYCEVSITLSDIKGNIDSYGNEMTIKRRVYRSGESEYYMNQKSCRLRDVKEVLMDTGIGKDGYSIIEQGKVEEILSPNPQNRRKVFDEACGIAKYRYKKIESERNLAKTEENLKRIVDIFSEIENQIIPLKKQKEKAEKYIEINDELKKYEVNDIIIKNEDLENAINDIGFQLNEINNELSLLESNKEELESELNNLEEDLISIENEIEEKNDYIFDLNNSINNEKKEKELTEANIENTLRDVERKKSEALAYEKKIELAREQLTKVDCISKDKKKEIDEYDVLLKSSMDRKTSLENQVKNIEEILNDCKSDSIKLLKEKEEVSNKITKHTSDIENIDIKTAEIEKNIDVLKASIEDIEETILKSEKSRNEKAALIDQYDNKLKSLYGEYEVCKRSIEEKKNTVNKNNMEVTSLKTKMNTYIDMEVHHDGFNRGVKEVLNNKELRGIHGAFGEIIKVEYKYEKAIEATLGAMIQNIIVDDEQMAKSAINYLKKNNLGRVTFLPLNIIKGNEINLSSIKTSISNVKIASNLVKYSPKYENVVKNALGRVIVVDNIDDGIKFSKETGNKYKVVTLDGELLNPGGSMTGGSIKTNNNILSRKRLIDELKQKIEEQIIIINREEDEITSLNKKLEKIDEDRQTINSELKEYEKNIVSIDTELKMNTINLNKYKENLVKEEKNRQDIESSIAYSTKELRAYKEKLDDILSSLKENEDEINNQTEILEEKKNEYNEAVRLFNEKNIEITKLRQIYENNISEVSRINSEIDNNIEQKDTLNNLSIEGEENIKYLRELVCSLDIKIKEKEEEFDKINLELEGIKESKKDLKDKCDEKKALFRNKERRIIDVREVKYKLDSKMDRNRSSRDNLLSSLYEKYELSYVQALEFRNPSLKIDYKKMDLLRKEKKNLGNVNLDAIKEYEEAKQRYDYYSEQKQDLEESIISINELIQELVKNMEIEFVENFKQINDNFKIVYKKLFGGGNADLKISDPKNVLECDIDIIAQPPGKKMKNLSLLSGGEKALTAICILFAILISKPTPFCILDEIEAPLDDVNIFRFGEYLKELSKDTQFIAVTHRRGTMEVSDYIYGVTMQEKGVSSVISLKLKEAAKIAEE